MKRETFGEGVAMADQDQSNMTESGSSVEGDRRSTCVLNPACETSMWEEWTQATSTTGDEVSTSNFLPELTSSTNRLSFQQTDMLATWMSSFHPLTQSSSPDHNIILTPTSVDASFMHTLEPPDLEIVDPAAQTFGNNIDKVTNSHRQLRRALGPLSPSSPLAIQNGMLNPLGDPWDSTCPLQFPSTGQTYNINNYGSRSTSTSTFLQPDHSSTAIEHLELNMTSRYNNNSRPRHTDIFIGPNGTFESSTPGGWTPQLMFDESTSVGSPMKLMASLREAAGEATSTAGEVCAAESNQSLIGERINIRPEERNSQSCSGSVTMSSILAECRRAGGDDSSTQVVWPGKHRLELVELVDGEDQEMKSPPVLKRPKITSVEHAKTLQWSDQTLRGAELRSYCPGGGSSSSTSLAASQAMDIIAIGPALNTNGKPRARRGSATDPQSVYARHRREKINERLKNLQNLVPNGAKVDIVTMLDEAIHYVKFLQNQVELLKSDDYWMYATPNNYNGMDLSDLCPHSQELESSAS